MEAYKDGDKGMPQAYILILEEYQRVMLTEMRDHHPKPYMRERASALLKIEAEASIRQVAQQGLLRPRHWETVASWVKRYEQDGLGGLYIQKGRGRKPAFPPSVSKAYTGGFGSGSGDLAP